jgi:hypothetical protein
VRAQLQGSVRLQLRPLQIERARTAAEGLLEIDIDAGVMIAPGLLLPPRRRSERTGATEQRREEIAEAFLLEYVRTARAGAGAAAELEAARPVRRRPELLAGLPFAAELVVGRALLRTSLNFCSASFSLLTSGWYLRASRR